VIPLTDLWGDVLSKELAELIAKRFIQRRDIKAVQFSNGAYSPDRELKHPSKYGPMGFKMSHLIDHLEKKHTYGHYLLDADSNCRLFCFDIDLEKDGFYIDLPPYNTMAEETTEEEFKKLYSPIACNPREMWSDRRNTAARNWLKFQMKMMATKLAGVITKDLGLECAVAYSGSKGVHVYGFTGVMPASEARAAAMLVMEILDHEFELHRGESIFRHRNPDPYHGFQNFTIEVYPKQSSLENKDLGNLLRLPLGHNLKSSDPTFFLDLTTPMADFAPHRDPISLLKTGQPFQ
jgi:hypothetical protein